MNPTARTPILRRLLEGCDRFRLAGPLSALDTGAFTGPADAGGLAAALAAEFGEDDLVACGVATRDGPGVAIAPALARPGGVIVVFRDPVTGDPVGLATDDGLVGGGVAAVAATRDAVYAAAAAGGGRTVFVTPTAADAATLRGLGFPAAPAGDLYGASPDDLTSFLETFGFERSLSRRRRAEAEELEDLEYERREREREARRAERAARAAERAARAAEAGDTGETEDEGKDEEDEGGKDEEEDDEDEDGAVEWDGPEVVVAGWSPAAVGERAPTDLTPLLERIRRGADLLRFSVDPMRVWRPADVSHERCGFYRAHGDAAGLAEALRDSVFDDCLTLHRIRKAANASDDPAAGSGPDRGGRPPAAGHPGEAVTGESARAVAEGLAAALRRAASDAPLEERVPMLIMADAYEVSRALGEVVRGSFSQSAARGAGIDPAIVPCVGQFYRGVDRVVALFKELRSCRPSRPGRNGRTIFVEDPDRPALPPPSPGSG